MAQLVDNDLLSSSLVRRIGYCLLVLALFDLISLLIPPSMNPVWRFQTIGGLVERVAVPLLGLVLVFYGESDLRWRWEQRLLKFLSWLALLAGVVFLLLAPLLILDTLRVDDLIQYQINAQVIQQIAQLTQLENQINQANTAKDISSITARLNIQLPANINNPQELKSRLSSEIAKAKEVVRPKTEAAAADKRFGVIKTSIKWFLGTIVSGSVFIYIWRNSRWARIDSRWSR